MRITRLALLPSLAAIAVMLALDVVGANPPAARPCRCEPDRRLAVTAPRLTGSDVWGLQTYLAKLGFSPGQPDGIYGPQTAEAVKEFQRRQNLNADGVVEPDTWLALGRSALKRRTPPPTQPSRVVVVIDVRLAMLAVLERGKVIATFPVALGKEGTPTPVGNFRITFKAEWGGGFGTRFLGLDVPWGTYGIHGTNKPWSIGSYESGGCIRLFNADIEQLYEMVAEDTPVHIISDPFYGTRELGPGETGAPVAFLQRRLKQLGHYQGPVDGFYGLSTERAVMAFQKTRGLPVTGRIVWEDLVALRVRPYLD